MKKKLFTDLNIKRIDNFLDNHLNQQSELPNGVPIFSSVEISINGACNRRCFFCPRVDEEKYPNKLNNLNFKAYSNLINDLQRIDFKGRLSFSGFCEPLLTKNLNEYVEIARKKLDLVQIEIVTNGDPILAKNGLERLEKLYLAGLNNCRVSLYDGEHQLEIFEKIKKKLKLSDEQFIIRKRYLGPEDSFGLTISNRAGSVSLKNNVFELKPLKEPLSQPCHYPFYKVLIDYDGSVLMCSNDWKKERIMGNICNESLIDIWKSDFFISTRKNFINCDRSHKPCNVCDVEGTLNGESAFIKWKKHLSK